jgi:hypothetical protein
MTSALNITPRLLNSDELKTLMGIDATITLIWIGALGALHALGVAPLLDVMEALAASSADRVARLSLRRFARN